jgi:hypothetical protein
LGLQHVSQIKGFPEISNKLLWIKQIEKRLQIYMQRVEDVLGSNWKEINQGKSLRQLGLSFRKKLEDRHNDYLFKWMGNQTDRPAGSGQ